MRGRRPYISRTTHLVVLAHLCRRSSKDFAEFSRVRVVRSVHCRRPSFWENLRSFVSGACDDYWNFAYWVQSQ